MKIATKFSPPKGQPLNQSKEKSMTRQEFKDECNLANIIQRFTQTGELYDPLGPMASTIRRGRPRLPEFLDMTAIKNSQDVFDFVRDAHDHFETLPARLKAVFNNNAEAFVAAMNNKEHISNLIKSGALPADLFGAAEVVEDERGAGVNTPATVNTSVPAPITEPLIGA